MDIINAWAYAKQREAKGDRSRMARLISSKRCRRDPTESNRESESRHDSDPSICIIEKSTGPNFIKTIDRSRAEIQEETKKTRRMKVENVVTSWCSTGFLIASRWTQWRRKTNFEFVF